MAAHLAYSDFKVAQRTFDCAFSYELYGLLYDDWGKSQTKPEASGGCASCKILDQLNEWGESAPDEFPLTAHMSKRLHSVISNISASNIFGNYAAGLKMQGFEGERYAQMISLEHVLPYEAHFLPFRQRLAHAHLRRMEAGRRVCEISKPLDGRAICSDAVRRRVVEQPGGLQRRGEQQRHSSSAKRRKRSAGESGSRISQPAR